MSPPGFVVLLRVDLTGETFHTATLVRSSAQRQKAILSRLEADSRFRALGRNVSSNPLVLNISGVRRRTRVTHWPHETSIGAFLNSGG